MRTISEGAKCELLSENAYKASAFTYQQPDVEAANAMRAITVLDDFGERRNGAGRRRELARPAARLAVEPHGLHARLRRPYDVRTSA
jgi:hypothetical protein